MEKDKKGCFSAELKDHLWRMYKEGQISADHTQRQVFDQMLDSLAQWLAQQPGATPSATVQADDARDARRYRWLRENADEVFVGEKVEFQVKYGRLPAQLDDDIDAAMQSTSDRNPASE